MPALFLNLLKIIFLLLIYIFLWQVARSMRSHGRARRQEVEGGS